MNALSTMNAPLIDSIQANGPNAPAGDEIGRSALFAPRRVTAAIKRAIEEDRFPRAPRLDPLRSVPAKLDPAAAAALWRPQVAKSAKSAVPQPRTAKAAKGLLRPWPGLTNSCAPKTASA
jgi:hypothetical protein